MAIRMTQERREAYAEVLEIVEHMDRKYQEKIPLKLRQFFQNNASKEYKFNIDLSIPLKEYELHESTINLLAMLNLNYWCEDEKHKQELINLYRENEEKYQKVLQEKYSYDNLFKGKKQEQNVEIEVVENKVEMTTYEETIIEKIISKIKKIISRFKI